VNALAGVMGSTQLECGDPARWPDAGRVTYIERDDTNQEAAAMLGLVGQITAQNARATIGVVGRRWRRMDQLRDAARVAGIAFEDWEQPTHVPRVVALLKHFIRDVSGGNHSQGEVLDELERLCREAVDPADATTLDEVASACDSLRDMVAGGVSVAAAVGTCRVGAAPDTSVAPGVHLLTGHRGKGQQFDWVFVIGLEDGHVPDFRSATDPEELRILHVMVSRACYGVVLTYSRRTMTANGWRHTTESPWLAVLRSVETSADIQ
jgi:DNA helicase-2/ATP-dependent DNA helicase PcrA